MADLEALEKKEVKAEAELPAAWLSAEGALQRSHRVLGNAQETYPFWAFKETSVQSLAFHEATQADASVATYRKEKGLSSEKPLNKQTTKKIATAKPTWGEWKV